jgi:drug/metabolite transporter (DMT)-like permease
VFAKFLYADGWDFDAVLTTRAVCALPVIAAWAWWRIGAKTLGSAPRSALLGAALAGALCYYLGATLDFYALRTLEVGIERALLFSYPSMVVLLYALTYRAVPQPSVLAAIVVTYAGILLVVSGFDLAILRVNLAGSGLVLACALTMAIYYLASDRWTGPLGSIGFTLWAFAAATACLVVQYLLQHGRTLPVWRARDAALIAGIVVIATVVPLLSMAEAVRRLGAERAAVVSTVGPPTTLLLGAWLLDERLRAAQWLGVALTVAGILILELARRPAPPPTTDV